jgi:hypothetical protein
MISVRSNPRIHPRRAHPHRRGAHCSPARGHLGRCARLRQSRQHHRHGRAPALLALKNRLPRTHRIASSSQHSPHRHPPPLLHLLSNSASPPPPFHITTRHRSARRPPPRLQELCQTRSCDPSSSSSTLPLLLLVVVWGSISFAALAVGSLGFSDSRDRGALWRGGSVAVGSGTGALRVGPGEDEGEGGFLLKRVVARVITRFYCSWY